jgi:hypothetical protein
VSGLITGDGTWVAAECLSLSLYYCTVNQHLKLINQSALTS